MGWASTQLTKPVPRAQHAILRGFLTAVTSPMAISAVKGFHQIQDMPLHGKSEGSPTGGTGGTQPEFPASFLNGLLQNL